MTDTQAKTPAPVMGLFDREMWNTIRDRHWRLQACRRCGAYHYPPGPGCSVCLSTDLEWKALSGAGRIISWIVYERQYLPAYPAPYNVIAVQLAEGPVVMSNLEGASPEGTWIGKEVTLVYVTMPDGVVLPRFRLKDAPAKPVGPAGGATR